MCNITDVWIVLQFHNSRRMFIFCGKSLKLIECYGMHDALLNPDDSCRTNRCIHPSKPLPIAPYWCRVCHDYPEIYKKIIESIKFSRLKNVSKSFSYSYGWNSRKMCPTREHGIVSIVPPPEIVQSVQFKWNSNENFDFFFALPCPGVTYIAKFGMTFPNSLRPSHPFVHHSCQYPRNNREQLQIVHRPSLDCTSDKFRHFLCTLVQCAFFPSSKHWSNRNGHSMWNHQPIEKCITTNTTRWRKKIRTHWIAWWEECVVFVYARNKCENLSAKCIIVCQK